jgi:hypothetical protein
MNLWLLLVLVMGALLPVVIAAGAAFVALVRGKSADWPLVVAFGKGIGAGVLAGLLVSGVVVALVVALAAVLR